jgi:hypothetical protein
MTVMFLGAKNCCPGSSMCWCIVIVNEPVLVTPSFQTFSVDLRPQTLQNLLVVMLVNCLAWRNMFLFSNAVIVKKDHQLALDV